jgi:ribonuclease Z
MSINKASQRRQIIVALNYIFLGKHGGLVHICNKAQQLLPFFRIYMLKSIVTRRRLIWMAGFLLVAFAVLKFFQAPIGQWMFDRAVERRVGQDALAGLPDGLHVALCGTGSPLPNADRAGACTAVIAGSRIFVVDAGEGGARNLQLMGVAPGRIERLFLTHFHSDHIDGLGPMMLLRWTGGPAKSPLPIHGPAGVEAVIAGFNAAYLADNGYRVAHHGAAIVPPKGAGAVSAPFDLTAESQVVFDDGGVRVTAFKVDHDPVSPSVGYRFDYKGRSVVLSGDTAKSAVLIKAAKNADLLVHEALQPKMVASMTKALEAKGIKNTAQITRDILDYHASPEEAAESAAAAKVQQLVLSHIVPAVPSAFFYPAFLGDAKQRFSGPIVVGEDGMLFSLPAGGKQIEQQNRL